MFDNIMIVFCMMYKKNLLGWICMNMYLDLLGFGLRICLAVVSGSASFSFLSGTGQTDIDMHWS